MTPMVKIGKELVEIRDVCLCVRRRIISVIYFLFRFVRKMMLFAFQAVAVDICGTLFVRPIIRCPRLVLSFLGDIQRRLGIQRRHQIDEEAPDSSERTIRSYELADLRSRLDESMDKVVKLQREVRHLKVQLEKSEEQKEDALKRLSEIISVKLRDNNPNIADLNDPFRPTKLAEISSELYDNEWTEAFDVLDECYSEEEKIAILLDIVMDTFYFCKKTVEDVWKIVFKWHIKDVKEDQDKLHWLKETRKANVEWLLPEIKNECFKFLTLNTDDDKLKELMTNDANLKAYINTCVKLCVYMCVQDPPCVMYCPGWSSGRAELQIPDEVDQKSKESNVDPNDKNGNEKDSNISESVRSLDKNLFREYTKSGKFLSFIVWPVLYLHDGGPVLSKGVAQGCKTDEK